MMRETIALGMQVLQDMHEEEQQKQRQWGQDKEQQRDKDQERKKKSPHRDGQSSRFPFFFSFLFLVGEEALLWLCVSGGGVMMFCAGHVQGRSKGPKEAPSGPG